MGYLSNTLAPTLVFFSIAFVLLSYVLYVPIPDGVEDAALLQKSSPFFTVGFYISTAAWYLGYDTDGIFWAGSYILTYLRSRNALTEFTNVEDWYEDMNGVPVKIYLPNNHKKSNKKTGAFLFLHGGGYTYGHPDSYHYLTGNISSTLQLPVFSINYRKAPKCKYPIPLNDVFTALTYLLKNADMYNIDRNNIIIGGDSAGGHLTISITLKLIQEQSSNKFLPKALILIYPATQLLTANTPSYLKFKNDMILSRTVATAYRLNFVVGDLADMLVLLANNHTTFKIREQYADKFNLPLLKIRGPQHLDGGGIDWAIDKYRFTYESIMISPLFAPDELLKQFPTTLIQVCEFDILRDEGLMFKQRLETNKVKVLAKSYKSIHGMLGYMTVGHKPAQKAFADVIEFIKTQLLHD